MGVAVASLDVRERPADRERELTRIERLRSASSSSSYQVDISRRFLLSLLAALRMVPAQVFEQHAPESGHAQASEVTFAHAEGIVTP